ncbi:16S rRNA (guanine(966)-N(2))-methyltransferase RsmD [Parahaliea maris]|uniref:Ribosomal RNA small subunit methyltransferase D n=1 Tax=Parahaliea maris TaxID=2716870 RepID=A0A5C8ZYZ4_9GAMM|nr:16S rRNA (guanine(966)-N(2))-methyltransferase RsmD [Parahaliea maris]TXS93805.1 16S rRNA (guanine(966)-N(2))-methyltransferase RsmD [Parahaliea maris]
MPQARKTRKPTANNTSELRIIGGQWRGRKLGFIPADGLRPTTDRVRETLFNWLAPEIHGARCLDLFSGSGALGLEALSRGAAHCDFVDTNSVNLRQIERHLNLLSTSDRADCHPQSASDFLASTRARWDIVFVDPPFGLDLAGSACEQLAAGHLDPGASIYLECGRRDPLPSPPAGWELHRDKTAGNVRYCLYHMAN